MKELRKINLITNLDGHGSLNYKISLPKKWIDELGFTKEDRQAIVEFDYNKIIIRKVKNMLLIKSENVDYISSKADYELEDGTLLFEEDWNGEIYRNGWKDEKDTNKEYKPVYRFQLDNVDLNNLEELHTYSTELKNVLNQLASDLENGTITWADLTVNGEEEFAQAVSSNLDVFSSLEENFHEYSGLIYDGAYSEHLTSNTPKGLTGDDISEEEAQNKAKEFFGEENVQEVTNLGLSENSSLECYNFSVKTNKEDNISIAISKKGGYIVYTNCNRDIGEQTLNYEEASQKAIDFLNREGFSNMKETYYLNNNGIVTINYAYLQENVVMYPDLVKVKVALDNGEILGIETSGYLNNHTERDIATNLLLVEEAKKNLNPDLNIQSENLAIIPTEYQTEILCYEFKGKVEDTEFLVYINAETGEEEDILIIYNTPNGTLTM